MKKDIAQKWVEALRSGKYRQGAGVLRQESAKGDLFCCLGVLCELAVQEGAILRAKSFENGDYAYDGSRWNLPESVKAWANMKSSEGFCPGLEKDLSLLPPNGSLADANDRGVDFDALADVIEKNYEQL